MNAQAVMLGALEVGGFITTGALLHRYMPTGRRKPKAPESICGCTHHLAMHDPETKKCSVGVKTDRFNDSGGHIGYTYPPCPCRQYVGPPPQYPPL